MSSSNNPKSFYNQSEYGATKGEQQMNRKPDDASSESAPPPPYSNSGQSSNLNSGDAYFRDNSNLSRQEEQAGLLGNPSLFIPAKASNPSWTERSRSLLKDRGIEFGNQNIRRTGYCKRLCGADFVCWGSTEVWSDLPDMIEFRDSIEIKIEGYVTGGRILVTPIEQRHEGKIWSQIQYTPELRSDISYRIERPDDDFTRLVLKMPQRKHNDDDCVQIHLDISLPYGARVARFITSNMDIEIDQPFRKELEAIDFQTTNGNIILNRWSGETLSAKTTNGNIKAQGSLSSGSSISLETTNGGITFFDTVRAKTTLQVSSTNGGIEALQTLEAEGSVQLKTTSGLIEVDMIEAPVVSITSSNGKVNINHARAETSFVTRTTNAPIQLTMEGVKNNHVNLKTTNAPIQLHMTSEFEGHFTFETSYSEKVIVKEDPEITYQENLKYFKQGHRRDSGSKGDLSVKTTNSHIEVSFDA